MTVSLNMPFLSLLGIVLGTLFIAAVVWCLLTIAGWSFAPTNNLVMDVLLMARWIAVPAALWFGGHWLASFA